MNRTRNNTRRQHTLSPRHNANKTKNGHAAQRSLAQHGRPSKNYAAYATFSVLLPADALVRSLAGWSNMARKKCANFSNT